MSDPPPASRAAGSSTAARRRGWRLEASHTARYLFALPPRRAGRCAAPRPGWTGRCHPAQPAGAGRGVPAGRLHDRHRGVGLRQVEPGEPGAGRTGGRDLGHEARGGRRSGRRAGRAPLSPTGGRIVGGMDGIKRLVESTRGRSGARRVPTSRPTPACSTTCASCSPRRGRRRRAATTPAASPSTSPRAAARPAKAKASSWSSCCSCRASTRRARPATAPATTRRRWRSTTADKNIAEVLGMTVDAACEFFADEPQSPAAGAAAGYRPRLSPPGTAGDRALGRRGAADQARHRAAAAQRGDTLYVLDEPTTGLIRRTSTG